MRLMSMSLRGLHCSLEFSAAYGVRSRPETARSTGLRAFSAGRETRLIVLMANIGNFDFLLQLLPAGRALFCRRN
jgi:hypothetical protein